MEKKYLEEDPFLLLNVKYSAELPTVREKFKKLVLKHHPDRGGDPVMFQRIKNAYSYIFKLRKRQQNEIKKQNRTFNKFLEQRTVEDTITKNKQNRKQVLNPSNLDYNTFNTLYEKNRIKDAYDVGRKNFLQQETDKKKRAIMIVKEPKIFGDGFLNNVKELGIETVDDFSTYVKKKGEVPCSDIKYAYENKEILENNMKNTRKDSYLSNDTKQQIQELRNKRNNISFNMTPQEKLMYDMQIKETEEAEQKRLHFINKQNEIAQRQFLRVSQFIEH